MPPFKEWKYKDATDSIAVAIESSVTKKGFDSNAAFVEKRDHWQSGDTWVGPDGGANAALRTAILQAVEKQFTPVDIIGEVLDNVANGLLNREADVSFSPVEAPDESTPEGKAQAEENQKQSDAMRASVSRWWDAQKLWPKARMAVKRARWSSRGALRSWIAPSATTAQSGNVRLVPNNLEFDDALKNVLLSAPRPDSCFVVTDPNTNERAGVYLFERDKKKCAEIWYAEGEDTFVRIVEDGKDAAEAPSPLKLGGRLPIAEMEADLLITEPVRRQQNRANFFESLLVRVGETAGFPERYTTNASPQGVWLNTPPPNGPALSTNTDTNGKTWYLHATPRTLGASITTELRGITIGKDTDGTDRIATPGVEFKEPTDPEYAIKASTHARATILHDCKQGHLVTDSTAEASGIAYQQARAGFEADLNNTKSPLEGMLRDTIECAIALAEMMSGVSPEQSFLSRFRCVVNLHVNAGPITPDEKRANAEMYKENLLSRESTMAANGVEDVAAESQAIDETQVSKASRAKLIAEAITALVAAGATKESAAKFLGLSEEELALFPGSPAPIAQ